MKIEKRTLRMAAASLFVLGMIVLAASPAEARLRQGGGARRGMAGQAGVPGMLDRITHQLDLTDEQAEKIHGITEESRQEAKVAREALADAREAFHEAVANGSEEEQIRSAAEALGKALGDEAVLRGKMLTSVREVLTDEQREQLDRFKGRMVPFRGRPARSESRDGMRPGRGNRPRRMGNPGPRGPWQGERGPAQWSEDRPGAGRHGRGAQLRGTMRGPQGRQRGMNRDQVGYPPRGPWRADRTPWFDQGPEVGRRGRGGRGRRGPLPVDRMFERADTNHDDALNREEIEAFRSRKADGSEARPW